MKEHGKQKTMPRDAMSIKTKPNRNPLNHLPAVAEAGGACRGVRHRGLRRQGPAQNGGCAAPLLRSHFQPTQRVTEAGGP